MDRVLGRLFPTAQYTGLLDADQQHNLQRQGLLNVGLNLLQAGAPSAHQAGTLANIGSSIQNVNFPEMAQQALALQAYRQQQAGQQAVAQVAARHPAKPNESREDAYGRLTSIATEIAALPGGAAVAEKFAPLLQALKPDRATPARWSFQTIHENGKDNLYRINEDTGARYLIGEGKAGQPKEPTPQERVAGSQYSSADESVRIMREIAQRNPEAAKAAAAAIHAGGFGKLGKAYAAVRGFTSDPDAQNFYTQYENMLLAVTPTYGGARPTQQLLNLEQAASLPAIGSGDFDTAFRHMEQRLADLRAKAGRAMTPGAPPKAGPSSRNPFRP